MLDFMGLFFIIFSFFKMLDLKGFPVSFMMYDPLAKVITIYGFLYPFIETDLGVMFLMRIQIIVAVIVSFITLIVTTVGIISFSIHINTILYLVITHITGGIQIKLIANTI